MGWGQFRIGRDRAALAFRRFLEPSQICQCQAEIAQNWRISGLQRQGLPEASSGLLRPFQSPQHVAQVVQRLDMIRLLRQNPPVSCLRAGEVALALQRLRLLEKCRRAHLRASAR